MAEIEISESMAALADFCSALHEAKHGGAGKNCYRDCLLDANIDADTSSLEICLCPIESGATQRILLQLRVEKDVATNELLLQCRVADQDEPCRENGDGGACVGALKVKLPHFKTSLSDIYIGREGNYYYVHLLVADGNQPVESSQTVPLRFQLGTQSCYQLGEGSHCPQVVPVEQFLNPPPEKPKLLTADFSTGAVLPWPVSLSLLMLASALVGWICAAAGESKEGPGATMATLMFLLGSVPFFARRVGGYTLSGLLIVAGAGVLVSLAGFLFKANVVVFPFLLMGVLLSRVFCYNAYGKAKAGLIDLEKNQPHRSKFIATRTEQEQNMLWVGDFAIVLMVTVLLVWGYSSIQAWIN